MNTTVDRSLIIKLIVLTALTLLVIWVMNNTYWAEESVPKSLKGEAATNPFYGAQKLSEALGAQSEWKHVLGELPATDSVMVLSYWHWDVIEKRREQLKRWVNDGGRLVLDSTLIANEGALKEWLGVEYHDVPRKHDDAVDDEEDGEDHEDSDKDDKPKPSLQSFIAGIADKHCSQMALIDHRPQADANRSGYQVCGYESWQYLTSTKPVNWGLRDEHGLQAVRVEVGRGSVTLFNAAPFLYREMIYGEHGLLFVAATQLHVKDRIYFLMDEDGVPLMRLVWRYGAPVVVLTLLLIFVALWRNGMRFGPMAAVIDGARRSLAEQIVGTGHFILRFNGDHSLHVAAVRALNDAARRHIAHYDRLDTQQRVEALAKIGNVNAEVLSHAIHFQGSRNNKDLRHAIAVIEQVRRQLLNTANKRSSLKT